MKYLLATDLDGTLLYPKRPIGVMTHKNRDFLRWVFDGGNEVVVATGRNSHMLKYLEKDVRRPLGLIGCNGGFVLDKNHDLIESNPIPTSLGVDIYTSMVGRYGLGAWLAMDQTSVDYIDCHLLPRGMEIAAILANRLSFRYGERYVIGTEKFMERMSKGGVYKLQAMSGAGSMHLKAQQAYVSLKDRYQDRLSIAVVGMMIEITSLKASKGRALQDYAARLGIPAENVIVVGDSGNDVSMFDNFSHSFAMSKADDWVKAHAAHVIDRVSDIRWYIENPEKMADDIENFPERRKRPLN